MRTELIDNMVNTALTGESISYDQALELETLTHEELDYLFIGTNRIREQFKGQDVKICSIVNAKSGNAWKTVPSVLNRAHSKPIRRNTS